MRVGHRVSGFSMSGPNPHLSAQPRTAAEFRAQAALQRKIAEGYGAGKARKHELMAGALKRAAEYDAKADALDARAASAQQAGPLL